jgi:hypothetical protein
LQAVQAKCNETSLASDCLAYQENLNDSKHRLH